MTDGENVYSNGGLDLNNLMPCDIEEADVKHIAQEYHKILIKTLDSDVVVISLSPNYGSNLVQERISHIFQFIKSLRILD